MAVEFLQLRSDGFEVRDVDVSRLCPFACHHINVLGRYSFQLPDRPADCGLCVPRTPGTRSSAVAGAVRRARHGCHFSCFRAVSWKSRAVCM
ncbi:hypothetical protein ABT218_17400 [Streptomyces sp. NPDC001455]|uniref:hypothetical protein n=1 Tax=Streptomyces sp. NPDC001455 TaxID=3154518 RepID=UPI00331DF6A5